jgi:hypothetical protein
LKDIEAGTKGIGDFVNNIVKYPDGTYWDPARTIRNSVSSNLTMISSGNIDWPTLIANSESLASAFEQEQDRAEKQSATSGERHRGTEIVTRHRVHGAFPRPLGTWFAALTKDTLQEPHAKSTER